MFHYLRFISFLIFISIFIYYWCLTLHIRTCVEYPSQFEDFWDGLSAGSFEKSSTPLEHDEELKSSSPTIFIEEKPLSLDDIDYFIHVSDIHINMFSLKTRKHFVSFLDDVIPLVKPTFVVATGDLTDGKDHTSLLTYQNEEEWIFYFSELKKRHYHHPQFWLDVPGNHDRFNVGGFKTSTGVFPSHLVKENTTLSLDWSLNADYYKLYGIQKDMSWMRVIPTKVGNISVMAIDGCPYPGPPRPANFFGFLTSSQLTILESQLTEASKFSSSLHRILIGHYPICTLSFGRSSSGRSFADLSHNWSMYLNGHLHNLAGGLGDELYEIHETGFAELEIGDLKTSTNYRIVSFHKDGTFSFSEHTLSSSPLLHIISPKDARFQLNKHENRSLSIRPYVEVLIFSNSSVESIRCSIDGTLLDSNRIDLKYINPETPLVSIPFDPSSLIGNTHLLELEVISALGHRVYKKHLFTLNREPIPISSSGNYILNAPFKRIFRKFLYLGFLILLFGHLMIPRLIWYLKKWTSLKKNTNDVESSVNENSMDSSFFYHIYMLAQRDSFFFPWLCYLLYTPLFPLCIGRMVPITHHWYSFYVWGIYDNTCGLENPLSNHCWLPLVDSLEFSVFFMYSFMVPCLLLLVSRMHRPRQRLFFLFKTETSLASENRRLFFSVIRKMIKIWWMMHGLLIIFILYINYGLVAVLFAPGISWFFIYNCYLYYYGLPKELKKELMHAESQSDPIEEPNKTK